MSLIPPQPQSASVGNLPGTHKPENPRPDTPWAGPSQLTSVGNPRPSKHQAESESDPGYLADSEFEHALLGRLPVVEVD